MQLRDVFGYLFDVGVDVLVTTLDKATGVVTARIGDSTAEHPEPGIVEWWQHAGFASRPAKPTQGEASCQGMVLKRGDINMIFASRDTRGTAIYGNLDDGETCVYSSAGQGREVFKKDGAARRMTTDDNTVDGNVIMDGISPVAANPQAVGGEWRVYAPWGGAWQDSTGYHLRTWHGVKVDAGGVVFPAPIKLSGSTYAVSADMISIDGAMVAVGRDNGNSQALVQALPLQVVMQAFAGDLQTFVTALGVYVSAIQGIADPTNLASPVIDSASVAFSNSVTALMGTITQVAATKAVTGS